MAHRLSIKNMSQYEFRQIAIVRQMVYNVLNILGAFGYRAKTGDADARAVPFRDSISYALSVALPCGRAVLF